jgi:hypothetical protein
VAAAMATLFCQTSSSCFAGERLCDEKLIQVIVEHENGAPVFIVFIL